MRLHSRPPSWHPLAHDAQPLHRPSPTAIIRRRPHVRSSAPTPPPPPTGRPAYTTTYRTSALLDVLLNTTRRLHRVFPPPYSTSLPTAQYLLTNPPLARHGPPTSTQRTHPPLPNKHPQNGWQHLSAALGLILSFAHDSSSHHVTVMEDKPDHHHTATNSSPRTVQPSPAAKTPTAAPPPYGFAPSSLYATLLADYTGPASIAVTTRDASLPVLAGAIPDSDNVHPSTRHQTLAGVLPREAAPLPDTSTCDTTAILRTRRRRPPPPPSSRKTQG